MRSALIIGAGGLGCPALWGLASRLRVTVVDDDRVDLSNLQRQILYRSSDVGRLKVESAADFLRARWPSADVEPVAEHVHEGNVRDLISGHDIVLDATDSFSTKFLLNDVCLEAGIPLVHGGVVGFMGQLMTILRGNACYRCIYEAPPEAGSAPSCQEAGVLGALCGVIGGLMADEALAVLAGRPTLGGTLLVFDARMGAWRRLTPRARASCTAHGVPEVASVH